MMVELLQSLGRLPGLSFLDSYANRIIGAKHVQRDHVDRMHELRGRGAEVAEHARAAAGGGRKQAGGATADPAARGATSSGRDSLRHGRPGNADRLRDGSAPPPPRERLRRRPDTLD
jgi:hypothetical protein